MNFLNVILLGGSLVVGVSSFAAELNSYIPQTIKVGDYGKIELLEPNGLGYKACEASIKEMPLNRMLLVEFQ